MTENLKQIKKLWSGFAAYYQTSLSDIQVQMYAEDCEQHPAEVIGQLMKAWRNNPKHSRLPLPGQLLELLDGGSMVGNAVNLATRLISAVKQKDSYWCQQLGGHYKGGSFEAEFISELGEDAWHVVKLYGGWPLFCDSFWNTRDESTFRAQLRQLCEDTLEKKKLGQLLPFSGSHTLRLDHQQAQKEKGPNRQQLLLLKQEAESKGLTEVLEQVEAALTPRKEDK